MSSARRVHYTYEQYLALERESPIRHEFYDGEIYAMAGGTPEHAALAAKVIELLGSRLRPGCNVMTSDLKVRIEATGLCTYPDASVACGRLERSPRDELAIVNPTLLVEVTSPSTEDYDRGEKLSQYRQIPSLRALLIVSHREKRITLVQRGDGGWMTTEHRAGESVSVASPEIVLSVDEVFSALDTL